MDVTANGAESGNHFTQSEASNKRGEGKKVCRFVWKCRRLHTHTIGFGAFLGIRTPLEWIFNRKIFLFIRAIINKQVERRISLERREMAFWHEGCGAALYANFSLSLRFLFVERRNGRPKIKMAEKGSPSMTSTLFCFPPPCYFVFRHLYKTSAEKEEDIYFPDGRSFFFFPSAPDVVVFPLSRHQGGWWSSWPPLFFLKKHLFNFSFSF